MTFFCDFIVINDGKVYQDYLIIGSPAETKERIVNQFLNDDLLMLRFTEIKHYSVAKGIGNRFLKVSIVKMHNSIYPGSHMIT